MTRTEAEILREQLLAEHPDRETHSFILSERDGVWAVAKVALPPGGLSPTPTAPASGQHLRGHQDTPLPGAIPNTAVGY